MIDEGQARAIAAGIFKEADIELDTVRELEEAWFFPLRTARAGCNGVIVNKRTGRVLSLASAFPVERDLAMYERGYQFQMYDLVVTAVHDLDATERALGRLPIQVREPTYEHGEVWRVARAMSKEERLTRLAKLPCIFPALQLYFHLEVLEEARLKGWFDFVALEYRWREW
jgi:hypothetical protein